LVERAVGVEHVVEQSAFWDRFRPPPNGSKTDQFRFLVKGRTKSRPGAGLDALYGQLLRRMPAEEVGNANTRFAVVIPTGAEAAARRVPRRVRDVLRIDVYAVSDDGQVERLAD